MERSTMLLIGKPSISIRAIYTMAMLNNVSHNQRVCELIKSYILIGCETVLGDELLHDVALVYDGLCNGIGHKQ